MNGGRDDAEFAEALEHRTVEGGVVGQKDLTVKQFPRKLMRRAGSGLLPVGDRYHQGAEPRISDISRVAEVLHGVTRAIRRLEVQGDFGSGAGRDYRINFLVTGRWHGAP